MVVRRILDSVAEATGACIGYFKVHTGELDAPCCPLYSTWRSTDRLEIYSSIEDDGTVAD